MVLPQTGSVHGPLDRNSSASQKLPGRYMALSCNQNMVLWITCGLLPRLSARFKLLYLDSWPRDSINERLTYCFTLLTVPGTSDHPQQQSHRSQRRPMFLAPPGATYLPGSVDQARCWRSCLVCIINPTHPNGLSRPFMPSLGKVPLSQNINMLNLETKLWSTACSAASSCWDIRCGPSERFGTSTSS